MAAASSVQAAGLLLMLLISLLSATASVFTEWVMNHSQYRHESLNQQNIKLYSIGMVLNAAYYLHYSGGQLWGFFADVSAPHWAVVLVLALMGLVTVREPWPRARAVWVQELQDGFDSSSWAQQYLNQAAWV
jgi:hypothetical protein